MSHRKEKSKKYKNKCYSKENKCDYDNTNDFEMTRDDLEKLNLLHIQLYGQILFIWSDMLSYESTIESINLLHAKYTNNTDGLPNPDIPALQSVYLALLARLILAYVTFTSFDKLCLKYLNGEVDFSLQPDIQINISNVFSLIGYIYALHGTQAIYERDLSQPIFGI